MRPRLRGVRLHSVDALHLVLGDALNSKRAQRELQSHPLETVKSVISLMRTNRPVQYTVVKKAHPGETVIFDAPANTDVLLYAHRAVFFDPLLPPITGLNTLEDEPSWSAIEARAILEKVAWLAPLVDHHVVDLANVGFASTESSARDWRAPRLEPIFDIPIPLTREYHWEQLRPRLVDAIGADPGKQLDDAWFRAAHLQLRNLLDSGGVFDPVFRSALEQNMFEFALRYFGRVAPPTPEAPLMQALLGTVVPDLSRLTPSMMVEVRERKEFERWRNDLGEALEELLKTDSIDSLRGRGIHAFQRRLQDRATQIDQQSRRSKTIEQLKGGVVSLVAGGIGITVADAILGANPSNTLAETVFTSTAVAGVGIAPLIRDWLQGRLKAQDALRNHYRAFIRYA